MGQAWCKEKSAKAQDSKSPLDRVFVRCAHTIYPGLKEEGSVLGGATQRVTSSEIGYAGSPPRSSLLQRGQSIDSVDRPFHPSDWVDVNLEVPCTPTTNFTNNMKQHGKNSHLAKYNERDERNARLLTKTTNGAPVPPPRRRKRRETLTAKTGDHTTDDEFDEPKQSYSQLATPNKSLDHLNTTSDHENETKDSDEEFVEIERQLQNGSLQEISTDKHNKLSAPNTKQKNHSTSSLPNVAELLNEDLSTANIQEEIAKKPPRHVKTTSLPRNASLCPPQTPERMFFSQSIEETATSSTEHDNEVKHNSNLKIDTSDSFNSPDLSLNMEADVKTSTPVKNNVTERERSSQLSNDVFESFKDESSQSRNSTLSNGDDRVAHEVDRSVEPSLTRDVGYVSKSSNEQRFSDRSSRESIETDELSSGILRDAVVESSESERHDNTNNDRNAHALPMIQRTISEESLPREMLVDELDDDEDRSQRVVISEISDNETSNQSVKEVKIDNDNFEITSSCSENNIQTLSSSPIAIHSIPTSDNLTKNSTVTSDDHTINNQTLSMTPSLLEFEAALTDLLDRKDEEEEQENEEKTRYIPEVEKEIVPLKFNDGVLPPHNERNKSQLINFPKLDRTNPFNDLSNHEFDRKLPTDDPPEKPSRLHRISLIEESIIDKPLIVPTPPRRRHRKSNLSLNDSTEPIIHVYSSNDRLI